jgi:GDP-L-fucose synthase
MNFYKNKKILVTGGTGMIGRSLVKSLLNDGADVTIVSLDDFRSDNKELRFIKSDLREFSNCINLCKNKDIVFHLAGVKGSPDMTKKKPASFFVPTITFNTNILEASRRCNVENVLYTSSIGVYSPSKNFIEEDVWKTFPSENDRFAGWAKRMGELQAEAYSIEDGYSKISIVRPANIYGPHDNFDPNNAMVIPSLINKAINSKGILDVWGDGSPIRDFLFADDCADAMKLILKKNITYPINIGSGTGVSIKKIVEVIVENLPEKKLEINWDTSKPSGDKIRLMNIDKIKKLGFVSKVDINQGIRKTIEWFKSNNNNHEKRYNSFLEN